MHDEELIEEEELPDVSGLEPVRRPAAQRQRREPLAALSHGWGYDSFRPLQGEAVAAALARRDALVVLPTGGGKSLCYQVPAACGAGVVLVVSPLIALMDDQVAGAREAGVRAAALHGNLDEARKREVQRELDADAIDLLYVSPERLCVGDLLPRLRSRLALLAVDEAHCVSHWGHDFRPEYRQLAAQFDQAGEVPRLALTATATPQVQDDIVAQLALRSPDRLVGHIDRANLVFRCLRRDEPLKQIQEVAGRHPGEGGIVYCLTRAETEKVAAGLVRHGLQAACYHAGLDPRTRRTVQDDFVNERLQIVVATVAFGMGIDRSNVRFVVHAAMPRSIEHYQQESGRAGRDGDPAECVLLWGGADLATHRFFLDKDAPPPERRRVLENHLRDMARYAVAPVCRHRQLVEHFAQAWPPPDAGPGTYSSSDGCGACDVCLGETAELPADQALVTAQKIISAVWRTGGRYGAGHLADVLLGRATDKVIRAAHHELTVFGLLKEVGEGAIRAWTDQLVAQGLLAQVDKGEYTLIDLTPEGRALCKGVGAVRLGVAAATPAKKRRRERGGPAPASAADAAGDAGLFERLRAWRRAEAERLGKPPYVVMHDRTLHAIAAARPRTIEDLRPVPGLGDKRIERYGTALLEVVAGG
ncbi:MAG: RecQ family ATP-dependent DNA helicase [Planctomycetes bacterium]|nr:RecQ family ATP-dependent DNA helicase [Planctomycetota bacterium]